MADLGRSPDKRLPKVALRGRHSFAGANKPLGRVSRTAESSLKEASLAEVSEFKVPSTKSQLLHSFGANKKMSLIFMAVIRFTPIPEGSFFLLGPYPWSSLGRPRGLLNAWVAATIR